MILDNGLILADAEAPPGGGAAPGGINDTSEVLAFDLGQSHATAGLVVSDPSVSELELVIDVTISFVAAEPTTDADVEVDFRLISMPILLSLLDDCGSGTGKSTFIVEVATDVTGGVAEDMFTLTAHGLLVGTPIFFNQVTTTTGVAIDTIYYVIPVNANVFQIATTRALAIAGTALGGLANDGDVDVQFLPFIHASTGGIPFSALQAGAQYVAKVQPYCTVANTPNTVGSGVGRASIEKGWLPICNRYLALEVRNLNGAMGTAGRFSANLVVNSQQGLRIFPTAVEVL